MNAVRSSVGYEYALLLTAVAMGCSGGPEPTTPGTDAVTMIRERACDRRLAPGCARADNTMEGCLAVRETLATEARAVDEGRARVDMAALDRCLEELNCGAFPLVCRRAFVGTGGENARCASSAECAPELFCDALFGECGRCVADLARGAECRNDAQCSGDDLRDDEVPACVRSVALEPGVCGGRALLDAAVGESCDDVLETSTREVRFGCPDGSVCDLSVTPRVCTDEVMTQGATCSEGYNLCDSGLVCRDGTCRLRAEAGEPCGGDGEDVRACDRADGLVCLSGECASVPDQVGDACNLRDGPGACRDGLFCIGGLCTDLVPNSGTCSADSQCESGYCDSMRLCGTRPSCH